MPDENKKSYIVVTYIETKIKYSVQACSAEEALGKFNEDYYGVAEVDRSILESTVVAVYEEDLTGTL